MTNQQANPDALSPEEVMRYSRHIIMPQVGPQGQRKLRNAKVLVVGAGGLGGPVALYLALAGVGTIGLVDFDVVDVTNLSAPAVVSEVYLPGSSAGAPKGRKPIDSGRSRMKIATGIMTASETTETASPTVRQPERSASHARLGKKISCPVAVALVMMPSTRPRRAWNQRVAIIVANAIDTMPTPRPTPRPQVR